MFLSAASAATARTPGLAIKASARPAEPAEMAEIETWSYVLRIRTSATFLCGLAIVRIDLSAHAICPLALDEQREVK